MNFLWSCDHFQCIFFSSLPGCPSCRSAFLPAAFNLFFVRNSRIRSSPSIISCLRGGKVKKLFQTSKRNFYLFSSRSPRFELFDSFCCDNFWIANRPSFPFGLCSHYLIWTFSLLAAAKVNLTFKLPKLIWCFFNFYSSSSEFFPPVFPKTKFLPKQVANSLLTNHLKNYCSTSKLTAFLFSGCKDRRLFPIS